MKDIDTKLVVWIITVIFLASGAWWSLHDVSADVSKIQETLDGQESELTIHVAADADDVQVVLSALKDRMAQGRNVVKQYRSHLQRAPVAWQMAL